MGCRICGGTTRELLDLGASPPANALKESPDEVQECYPLVLELCENCGNAQLRDCLDARDLYCTYSYLTPDSSTLSGHYENLFRYLWENRYVHGGSYVLEIGSNTGRFLQHIRPSLAKVLGIDPATNVCEIAQQAGVPTICDFFNRDSAVRLKTEFGAPDLIVARHCFAHNRDPHQMLEGVTELLDASGHFIIENAYLLDTIENNEFDQIYHEHMFYYSIRSMKALLKQHGMHLVDVLMASVHGGSIVFVTKKVALQDRIRPAVGRYESRERRYLTPETFNRFVANTLVIKERLRTLVHEATEAGRSIYAYGATAKGNTLLNFVGLTSNQIAYCVDSTPTKQGRYLPKSNIQVISEDEAARHPPDYFLLTAWNYKDEIIAKVRGTGNNDSKFIVPIPQVYTT